MQNWLSAADLSALIEVMFINVVLSGDNAVIVGMAAAGLEPRLRSKAIAFGIVFATVLRIGFALVAVEMLRIVGVLLVGGLLLGYVAWKMFGELREAHLERDAAHPGEPHVEFARKSLRSAIWQIIVADISMSLDDVLSSDFDLHQTRTDTVVRRRRRGGRGGAGRHPGADWRSGDRYLHAAMALR